jgi:hypothetical protein
MKLAWSNDQESYIGARVATGKVGQVTGDDADEKGYPGPACWGLVVKQISPGKREKCVSRKPQRCKGWD